MSCGGRGCNCRGLAKVIFVNNCGRGCLVDATAVGAIDRAACIVRRRNLCQRAEIGLRANPKCPPLHTCHFQLPESSKLLLKPCLCSSGSVLCIAVGQNNHVECLTSVPRVDINQELSHSLQTHVDVGVGVHVWPLGVLDRFQGIGNRVCRTFDAFCIRREPTQAASKCKFNFGIGCKRDCRDPNPFAKHVIVELAHHIGCKPSKLVHAAGGASVFGVFDRSRGINDKHNVGNRVAPVGCRGRGRGGGGGRCRRC